MSLFRGLDPEVISALFGNLIVGKVDENVEVLTQGQIPTHAVLVLSGAVEVSHVNFDGDTFILDIGREQSLFGEFELLSNAPILASCKAIAETKLLYFSKAELLAALQNPQFVENLMTVYHTRFKGDHVLRITDRYGTLMQRVCSNLIAYADEKGEFHGTQSYLSNVVGCSRQALNREIRKLVNEGCIAIFPKRVVIRNIDELERILRG